MPRRKHTSPLSLVSLLACAACSSETPTSNDNGALINPGGSPSSGVVEAPKSPMGSLDAGMVDDQPEPSTGDGEGIDLEVPVAQTTEEAVPGEPTPNEAMPDEPAPDEGTPDEPTPSDAVPDEQSTDEAVPDEQSTDENNEQVPDPNTPGFPSESACLADVVDFNRAGPFKFETARSGEVKLKIPQVPEGCKVPVVHLANGTGATCVVYDSILQRLASFGFITACYEDTNTGAGTQGIEAISTVLQEYGDLAALRIGSMGHSQGGQAAFTVLEQAEAKWGDSAIYAGLAMQPASGFGEQPNNGSWTEVYGRIESPVFMFSGTADVLVSETWVASAFSALDEQVEAYHWSAIGSTHIPTPNDETAEVAVPWFRWKLLSDPKACEAFQTIRGSAGWEVVRERNAGSCGDQK